MNIKHNGMKTVTSRSGLIAISKIVTKSFRIILIKHFLVLLAMVFVSQGAWAQAVGDYRTANAGNWSNTTNVWQRCVTAGTWAGATTNTYPGQNPGTGVVTVRNAITLDVSPANEIGSLDVQANITPNNSNRSLTISGDFSISAGTLSLSANNGRVTTINVGGNFTMSGGTITESSNANGSIIFNKAGTQIYTKSGGTISNTINFTVNSGSNLDLGTSVINGSTGTFTLSSGATLTTANANGINSAGGSGSIQTSTRSFSSGANYVYNAAGAQNIGTFTTTPTANTVNSLETLGSGLKTMSTALTASTLNVGSGTTLNPAANNLTVTGVSSIAGILGDSNAGGTTSLQDVDLSGGTINHSTLDVVNIGGMLTMPTGNGTIGNVNLTVTGGTTIASGSVLNIDNVGGAKIFNGSVVNDGSWNCSVNEDITFGGGLNNSGTLFTSGSGAYTFNATQNISGSSAIVFGGSVVISGAVVVSNTNSSSLTVNGVLNGSVAGSTWTQTNGSTLNINNATAPMVTGVLNASASTNSVNYNFNGAQAVEASTYNNLILSTSGTKTANGVITVGGSFTSASGIVFSTANNVSFNGTTTCGGGSINATAGIVNYGATATNILAGTYNGLTTSGVATMCGDVTTNGVLDFSSGSFSLGANTLTLNGTIASCSTLVGGASSNIIVGGAAVNTILPSVNLNNLTLNRANGVTLCGDVTVDGTLTLTTGNLSLSNSNLTLGSSAVIAGSPYSGTKMVETNGTGSLIKLSTTAAGFNITYPVGVGSLYNPMMLSAMTATPVGTASISVRAVTGHAINTSTTDLNKYWIISSSNLGLTSTNISLSYVNPNDVSGTQSEYALKYSTTPADVWNTPNTPSGVGVNPLTSTASTVLDGTWTARETTVTWYSLRTGNWNDPTVWTLDPAGSLINNPTNSYPQTLQDNVVVKNGRTISMNLSNITCKNLTVEGTLDLVNTTGHSFTTINGNGRIMLSSNSWPDGDATNFITAGQGEGTVVFYGSTNFSLTTPRTFYNMEVMMSSYNILTLMTDYTLNGNLEVKTGTFKINDDAATAIRTLIVKGNVDISGGANVRTGLGKTNGAYSIPGTMPSSGNYHKIYHQFEIWGDFTNNGSVRFTNQSTNAPVYNQFTNTGAVTVWFKGLTNNVATCNGTTDFYNLVIDKGTDQTYILELNASATNNFALYGPNSVGRNENAPFTALNPEIRKALWIFNGTLKLTGDIAIPTLSEGSDVSGNGDYAIGGNACLWIASANVSVYSTADNASQLPSSAVGLNTGASNQALSVYGKYRITAGTFATRNSAGLIFWSTANAVLSIEGGTTTVSQFRSAASGTGQTSYLQSGGILKVDAIGEVTNGFPLYGFDSSDGVFVMSGGEIQVLGESGNTNDIYLPISDGNYNVTGGKLTMSVNGNVTLDYYSNVPFYNIEISRLNASNTATVGLKTSMKVLNDLTLGNNSTLASNNLDLTIGGNFSIGATASTYTAGSNTTTFNGAKNSAINNSAALTLNKVTINKSAHPTVGNYYDVSVLGAGQLTIGSDLTLSLGSFNTKAASPNVTGNIAIVDGFIANTTGATVLTGSATQTLSGSGLSFGSLTLNNGNNGVQILSDVVVNNLSFNSAGTAKVNIGIYNLKVTGTISNSGNSSRYIYGAGNASDGGLSLYVSANGAKNFPIGIVTEYTPCDMTISNYSDDGYVTCTPVNESLQTTLSTGGVIMPYYWRINYNGFTTQPKVSYVFTYAKANDVNYIAGKVLDESPYTRSPQVGGSVNDVVEASKTILFSTPFTLEKANYTAGAAARFTGSVKVYYTKYSANDAFVVKWNDGNNWTLAPNDLNSNGQVDSYEKHDSRQPVAGAFPGAGDIAVIGWSPWTDPVVAQRGLPHGLSIDGYTQQCAEVIFSQMTDASGNPVPRIYRYPFQFRPTLCINAAAGNLNASMVRGEGMFWNRYSDPDFSLMDIGEFAAQDSSYILYETTGPTLSKTPVLAPNLTISTDGWGSADRDITLTKNIVTTGNFEVLGNANIVLPITATGDINVGRDFIMFEQGGSGGGARLVFTNSTINRTVTIGRDLLMNNNGALISVLSPNTTIQDHNLIVGRNIVQNTTTNGLVLWTANNQDRITLVLNGTSSMTYELGSGSVPELYRLIVNKGSGISTTAQFNNDFNLNGTTSGVGVPKSLVLSNGLFIVNNAAVTLNLTTGNDNFVIPASAGLEMRLGVANATGTSGIDLDGLLKVSGGTLNMSGGDNPIIIGASGASTLDVSAGTLTVGGQIRRATNSEVGMLKYYQSGGAVYVGRNMASATTRGTFEVMGTGSVFSVTAGDLYIERASSATMPGLYLMPETTSLSAGNTIHIGSPSVGSQTIGVYSAPTLQNIDVLNSCTAKLLTVPLTLAGNLSITSGVFHANGLALNIAGNFNNSGTFTHGNNTTTFNGGADQAITGATTFYNLTKSATNTITTNSAITISKDLVISSGILADNGNTITVKGNATINGVHQYTAGAGKGILLDNTLIAQNLYGSGTIGKLTINNAKGVDVPVGNALTISNDLRLEAGVLNIDKNLLTLSSACTITPGNAFSASNMIQTNASFTDNGVTKIFPSGASTFIYPVGAGGRYTPVEFTVASNGNSTGSITVKSAAEYHPTVIDPTNVLQYYWGVSANGMSGFTADATYKYESADVRVTGVNTELDYIAARLLSNGLGQWTKFDNTTVDESTNKILFSYIGAGDAEINGDYTAGINDAIPATVPRYESSKDGDWTDVTVWSLIDAVSGLPGTPGVGIPVGGPRGSIATVKHVVTSSGNGISSYNTVLEGPSGNLILGSTYGHRLGIVAGTGTLTCAVGDLPASDFTQFFAASGGTLEYNGSGSIDILTDLPIINNLKLSGNGTRRLPNIDIQLLGSLNINGPIVDNDTYDKTIRVKGNVNFDSGTFTAGNLSTAKFVLNGSTAQIIDGASSFTGSSDLYHFELNNSAGATLNRPIDVSGNLTLTNGMVTTSGTNILKMTSASATASAGTSTSYVNGPMQKQITSGNSFVFPIGNSNRLGSLTLESVSLTGLWKAQYFSESADFAGLTTSNMLAPVAYVSTNEYWNVVAPAAATAVPTLRWDNSSGVNPNESGLRGVQWASTQWIEVPLTSISGTSNSGSAKSSSAITFNLNGAGNYFTFGAITLPAYTWTGATDTDWFKPTNWSGGIVPSASSNTTIANVTNKPVVSGASVAQTNSLTINSSATMTLAAGSKMTINGSLVNNGTIFIQNSNSSMASLITKGAITTPGITTVTNATPIGAYRYYGFSVSGSNVTSTIWNVATNLTTIGAYYHNDSQYVRFTTNGVLLGSAGVSGSHGAMNGYSVKIKGTGSQDIVSSGGLNNGNISTNLVQNKWALLCNPYPSAIDMSMVYSNSLAQFGAGKIDPTYWMPYDINGVAVYSTYNLASGIGQNGGSKIVGPQQAYWLKNTSTTNTYSLNLLQSARLHAASVLKSLSSDFESDILRINLEGGAVSDEVVVAFRENGSVDFNELDSEKRLNTGVTSSNIYTIVGAKFAAIEVQPLIVDQNVVPLGLNLGTSAAGNYKIVASNIGSFDQRYDVYLDDLLDGVTYDLRQVGEVPVSLNSGVTNDRFVLRFTLSSDGVPTSIPDRGEVSSEEEITIQQLGNEVLVDIPGDVDVNAHIELYAVEGQLIRVKKGVEKVTRLKLPDTNAVYVVRVVNGAKVHSSRVVSLGK